MTISKQLSCSSHREQLGPSKDWSFRECIGGSNEESNRNFESKIKKKTSSRLVGFEDKNKRQSQHGLANV